MLKVLFIVDDTVDQKICRNLQDALTDQFPDHEALPRRWGKWRRQFFRIFPLWSEPDAIVYLRSSLAAGDIEPLQVRGSDVFEVTAVESYGGTRFFWHVNEAIYQESV